MDWSKAKTYLILTFLFLDLLLGYQYYSAQEQAQEYVQSFSTQLQELKDVLKEHKMVLQTDVPRETPTMRFLQVSHPKKGTQEIAESLLKNAHLVDQDRTKGTLLYRGEEGEFGVTGDGYFTMKYVPQVALGADENSSKIGALVLQRIAPSVWHSDQYKEDLVNQLGSDTQVIRYLQSYQKYPIFSALLEVHLQNDAVIRYNQKALEVNGEEENGQRVLSAVSAVRSVAESLGLNTQPATKTGTVAIKSIELGYYSPNYGDADVWYLAPMWRVITDQNLYYVNAFTGQVESGGP